MKNFEKDMPFSQVLDLWLEHNRLRLKRSTVSKYQAIMECHILPELGKLPLSQLSATLINRYLLEKLRHGRRDQATELSPSYVRSMTLIINAATRYAVAEGLMAPLTGTIVKPPEARPEHKVLDPEDQRTLEARLTPKITPTGIGILISLHTGLRIGEVCALRWDHVDLRRKVIHVRYTVARIRKEGQNQGTRLIIDTPKTQASNRDIPISSWLFPHLQRAWQAARSPYVISETPDFLSPRTYEYRYHQELKRCGVGQANYHALRHTFATRCIESGVDVKSLSEMLGHASVNITLNTYVHSNMELKRAQLEKLAAISYAPMRHEPPVA